MQQPSYQTNKAMRTVSGSQGGAVALFLLVLASPKWFSLNKLLLHIIENYQIKLIILFK